MNVLFFVSAISWWQICYPCLSKLQNIWPCEKFYAPNHHLRSTTCGIICRSVFFHKNTSTEFPAKLWWWHSNELNLVRIALSQRTEFHLWDHCHPAGTHASLTVGVIMVLSKPSQCLNISVCWYIGMLILQIQSPQVATFCCFFFGSLLSGMSHSSLSEDDDSDSLDSAFPASGRFRAL